MYVYMCVCSENQQFLKDMIAGVLEGQGVGWLKVSRVKKLMEDENYRNFVVSRLNTTLNKKLTDEDQHLEDVVSGRHWRQRQHLLALVSMGLNLWCFRL